MSVKSLFKLAFTLRYRSYYLPVDQAHLKSNLQKLNFNVTIQ